MAPEIYLHPDRKAPRIRPLKAMRHFKNLVADKEDTEQVFYIVEALAGKSYLRNLKAFVTTPKGATRYAERTYLPPLLDDHDTLKQLPQASVGRAYVDFMEREGLSAQGLVDEYAGFEEKITKYDDDMQWYGNRMRDTHDLLHILTGYGRDALGEATLLAFTHGQHDSPGAIFISYMAIREMKRTAPKDVNLSEVYREGKRNGKLAANIATENIMELLAENLEDARERLNIAPPVAYQKALRVYNEHDMDPYAVLAAA